MRKRINKKCVACGKEFLSKTRNSKASSIKPKIRPRSAITCSKKCSREYGYNRSWRLRNE